MGLDEYCIQRRSYGDFPCEREQFRASFGW